jgi:hypothetical protein
MKTNNSICLTMATVFTLFLFSCKKEDVSGSGQLSRNSSVTSNAVTIKVFARNLNNPRGLKWGPDGNLYVAEGGKGGTDSTRGICKQVVAPIGPYRGSRTGGRISKITPDGVHTILVRDLPSSQTSAASGAFVSGVADVAFLGDGMYAVLSGAGCSHGVQSMDNGVVKIFPDGSWKFIANLSAFQHYHPVKNPEPDDFEPDGTWYSMITVKKDLYALEPNHGELVRITRDGQIKRIIDISAFEGHIVPTALGFIYGNFYMGNLNPFPIIDGSSKIYKITMDGQISVWAEGFTTVLGITFDSQGRMYVLENTTGNPFPTPGTGDIIRVNKDKSRDVIASHLSLPTGMTMGPDGKLYVSVNGFGPNAIGGGQILQISVTN